MKGIEVIAFDYQTPCWDKPQRAVGIQQKRDVRANAKGKQLSLFAEPAIVSMRWFIDLDLPFAELWYSYRERADCENRIKFLSPQNPSSIF